jgi:hypothetical protein
MGAMMNNEFMAMALSVLLFAAMGLMCADALVAECPEPGPVMLAGARDGL